MNDLSIFYYASPLGPIRIEANNEYLTNVVFDSSANNRDEYSNHLLIRKCVTQLGEYFKGKLTEFTLPLESCESNFRHAVRLALTNIDYGYVMTYQTIAQNLGNPNAARAVGNACNQNPFHIIIPCHRVVGKDHALTGYKAGIEYKKWLLEHEYNNLRGGDNRRKHRV